MRTIEDTRDIKALHLDGRTYAYCVGAQGVTKIIAYEEYGEMAMQTWFEVLKDETTTHRINGSYVVAIDYQLPNAGAVPRRGSESVTTCK